MIRWLQNKLFGTEFVLVSLGRRCERKRVIRKVRYCEAGMYIKIEKEIMQIVDKDVINDDKGNEHKIVWLYRNKNRKRLIFN